MDDGRIETVVEDVTGEEFSLRVVRGGYLQQGKGVNLPDTEVRGSVLSQKDLDDLAVARDLGVEIVAVSFVQSAADVVAIRELVGEDIMVFAKIERPQALARIDEICAVSDGVMAARGDLGVETPYESVPDAQSRIALSALRQGVVSICATEMLESMTTSSRPTRAEVADVSGAVRDGFDAVMLSGETAVGLNPSEAVRAMARICQESERHVSMPNYFADENPGAAAVTAAASALARPTTP
jgi:pyruvate kinase